MKIRWILVLCCMFLRPASSASGQTPDFDDLVASYMAKRGGGLLAGAATVDITPVRAYGDGVYIAGFMQGRKSTGVSDPISARALFLFDGKIPVVLVSLDLVGYSYDEVLAVRATVTDTYGGNIIIASVHNHEGPDVMGYWGPGLFIPFMSGVDRKYNAALREKIAGVIREAAFGARPARLRFGSTTVPAGLCANLWGPPDQQDHEMSVMNVEDAQGKPIATLINYGCHAETLGEFNTRISADFPGQFYKAWESRSGGVAMFISGAGGGMITPLAVTGKWGPLVRKIRHAEKIGRTLSEKAGEALKGTSAIGPRDVRIALKKEIVSFPMRNRTFEYAFRQGILHREQVESATMKLRAEVNAFSIGPAGFVSAPGELFPSLDFTIKSLMREKYKFVLTLANDELGYMMTKEQFHDETYAYEQSMSLGEDTGPILMDAVATLLGKR